MSVSSFDWNGWMSNILPIVTIIACLSLHMKDLTISDLREALSNQTSMCNQLVSNQTKIEIARAKLNKMECLEEVPDEWMQKWKPDFSKWKGYDDYVLSFEMSRQNELCFARAKPVFEKVSENVLNFHLVSCQREDIIMKITGPCIYTLETQEITLYLNEGYLFVEGNYKPNNGNNMNLVTVYKIDNSDLI